MSLLFSFISSVFFSLSSSLIFFLFNQTSDSINEERPCTMIHRVKKELSICQSLLTELTRQMTLPTENGHAAPPVESRMSCQSVNAHPRVEVDCGAAHALRVQPTASPHPVKRKKGLCPARASTSGLSCDRRVRQKQKHCPLNRVGPSLPLRSGEAPATFCTHTPCSGAYPQRELLEMCLVLTDDTRLARPEQLQDVGDIVEGRLVMGE